MLAATHFDNLLVLLFFAIAILFQILTSAAAKSRKRRGDTERRSTSPSQRSRPLTTEEDETDQDRIRKFLEALGQPTTSKPPPPVAPRTDIPPRPIAPILPPGEMTPFGRPGDLKRAIKRVETRKLAPETRTVEPKVTEAPQFEIHAGPPPLESITEVEPKTTAASQFAAQPRVLVTMLRSTSGLRDAIILREIFGPPRSMQPLDLVRNF